MQIFMSLEGQKLDSFKIYSGLHQEVKKKVKTSQEKRMFVASIFPQKVRKYYSTFAFLYRESRG